MVSGDNGLTLTQTVQIIEALAMIGGGGMILVKMGKMMGVFESIGKQQAEEITEIKEEIKEIRTVVTTVAVQKTEINGLRDELKFLRDAYNELRHGKGIIK